MSNLFRPKHQYASAVSYRIIFKTMYAPMDAREWPIQFEELQHLMLKLNQLVGVTGGRDSYQAMVERRIFLHVQGPEFRFAIIKWSSTSRKDNHGFPVRQRELLGTYEDYDQVLGMMRLLVSNAEVEAKSREQRPHIVISPNIQNLPRVPRKK